MYFHHAAGVVAKLEAQAGVFWKNQKQSGQIWNGSNKNLTGKETADLKNINEHFGLPLLQAKQLLEYYKQQSEK